MQGDSLDAASVLGNICIYLSIYISAVFIFVSAAFSLFLCSVCLVFFFFLLASHSCAHLLSSPFSFSPFGCICVCACAERDTELPCALRGVDERSVHGALWMRGTRWFSVPVCSFVF